MSRAAARRPTPDVTAAELALGVLDGPEREAAEARAAVDPAFAAEAADWSARLHPLTEEVAPVDPSPAVWERIAAALPPGPDAAPAPAAVEPAPDAAADTAAPAPAGGVHHWRRLAGIATAVAAVCVLALVLLLSRKPLAPPPLLTARLEPPAALGATVLPDSALYAVTVDRGRALVLLTPVGPGPVDARVRELWLLPRPGAPAPLGVIAPGKPLRLPRELTTEAKAGAMLAVSLEPKGGSPTGRPTGPVIALGSLGGG